MERTRTETNDRSPGTMTAKVQSLSVCVCVFCAVRASASHFVAAKEEVQVELMKEMPHR